MCVTLSLQSFETLQGRSGVSTTWIYALDVNHRSSYQAHARAPLCLSASLVK